ncbi:saccharopine dehydrogenase NADP-binding domain-containing protein [Nonomuraea sp. NPDC049480]|uniref:saccharopine dehydrogenase NADP-binding domain-containing protein n=1 Tax=Nonomuraea sp. NPDC049480 TaxID=3364353 RepID=UPI00379C0B7E
MIGVLGGYGAVGSTTARLLTGRDVRVGGRDGAAARRFVRDALRGQGEAWQVDADDPASLARFCRGCRVVVNCAGPSYLLQDRVARAARAAGADYVDAAGNPAAFPELAPGGTGNGAADGWVAVVEAGMLPGLTGVLPRHLAALAGSDSGPLRLDVYTGGLDRLTPAAAGDVMLVGQEEQGAALAAWRGGGRVARALTPAQDVELPYFPGPVTAYPYLSAEAERVAGDLGLAEARWYNVITGDRILATAATAASSAGPPRAAGLARAAELELAGRTPYYVLLFQLSSPQRTRTLALRTADSYALTAAVVAHATTAVLEGGIPPGVHHADAVLDPARMPAELDAVATIEITDGLAPIDLTAPAFEEGAL